MSTLRRSSSSYGGFADGIILRGMPLLTLYPGNIYWVDKNGGGGSKGTFNHPCLTIVEAMALTTASNGDIIVCKPGHIEYISASADLACSKATVAVIGTGCGAAQSKIIFDTADTASITVTASDVSFVNMWFEANFANVDGAIEVSDAGHYFTVQGCRVTNTSTALDFEEFINLAVGADYFSFIGNDVHLIEGSDGESLVCTVGESLGMRVMDNNIIMEASTSIFDIDATAITGGPIFRNNAMLNLTAAADYCVEIAAATVGLFIDERYACAGETIPIADTTASFFVNCFGSELANVSSLVFPKTATAWP